MPSVAKYRKTYFACVKALGMQEEDRHAFNEARTGKESTAEFTERDWEQVIAWMQRALGDHQDHRAHVREDAGRDQGSGVGGQDGSWATSAQISTVQNLVDEIEWRKGKALGPLALLCTHVLQDAELRKTIIEREFERGLRPPELWGKLTRSEASLFIRILLRMTGRNACPTGGRR